MMGAIIESGYFFKLLLHCDVTHRCAGVNRPDILICCGMPLERMREK
jgi:hypothetical protein